MRKSILALALLTAAGSVAAQTVAPPQANPSSVTTPGATPVTPPSIATTPPASGGSVGVAGEAQARARIERDGYTNVTGLTKGADGTWQGTAMRGSSSVQVSVDARGNVTTQ